MMMEHAKLKVLGAVVGLARAAEGKELLKSSADAMLTALIMAYSESEVTENEWNTMVDTLHKEKYRMSPDCAACQCPCGRTDDYDMEEILHASPDLRETKLTLFSLLAALAAKIETSPSPEMLALINDALFLISCTYEAGQLTDTLDIVRKTL